MLITLISTLAIGSEGMWLPESAVDEETLAALAEAGILFTVLAPEAAAAVRPVESEQNWLEVAPETLSTSRPYRWTPRSAKGPHGGAQSVRAWRTQGTPPGWASAPRTSDGISISPPGTWHVRHWASTRSRAMKYAKASPSVSCTA